MNLWKKVSIPFKSEKTVNAQKLLVFTSKIINMTSHIAKLFLCSLLNLAYVNVVAQHQRVIKFVPIDGYSIEETPFLTVSIENFYNIRTELIQTDSLSKYQSFFQNEVVFAAPL
jgi:hypothetical protein